MSFEVRINGNNINNYLISYTRNHNLCEGVGKIKLEVDNNLSASIGDTIVLYEDSIKKGEYFLKEITNVVEEGKKIIDGQDDSWKLENFFITDNLTVETAQTNLYYIEWLLSESGVDYDLDVDSSEAQYLELGTTIGMENAIDLLKNLCRYSAWYFWFDANNTCHISKIKTDIANTSETLTDDEILDISVKFDEKMLRNRGLVYGGANLINGGYIVGEQTRRTGYEYDNRDLRTVVYSNPNLSYQSSVNTIARKLVDEFAKITVVKDITLPGFWDLQINDSVFLQSEYYTGACLIMALESSATEGGMLTKLTLDSRCPKLVTFFEHDYVYIGTAGMGVWRKPYTIIGSWENYSAGIAITDLHIKDLKINNGLFACVGGNNIYVRTVNTNWIKINLPSDYSDYFAKGVDINITDNTIHAVYTNNVKSILVKLIFTSIQSIEFIKDFSQKDIIAIDVDHYNNLPTITGFTGISIDPNNLITIYPISGYSNFSNRLVVHWAYYTGGKIYIDFKVYNSFTGEYIKGLTPFLVGDGSISLSTTTNSCSYLNGDFYYTALYENIAKKIIVVKYSISANSASIDSIIDLSSYLTYEVTSYRHILFGDNWYFDLRYKTLVPLSNFYGDYYFYKNYIIRISLKVEQQCTDPPPGHPPCSYFTQKRYVISVRYTIIDLISGTYKQTEFSPIPPTEWGSSYPSVYFYNPFLTETIFGGIPTYFTVLSISYNTPSGYVFLYFKLHVHIDSGTYNIASLTSQEASSITKYRSLHRKLVLMGGVISNNVATRSVSGKIDFADYYYKISSTYGTYRYVALNVDDFTFEELDYLHSSNNLVYTIGEFNTFNYFSKESFFKLTRKYISFTRVLDAYSIYDIIDSKNKDLMIIPTVFSYDTNVIADTLNLRLILDDRFFEAHFGFSYYSGLLIFSKQTTPFTGFSTYIKDGNLFKLIDLTPSPSVLENNLGSNIITYFPVVSGEFYPSLRVSFIDDYGEFYSPSGNVLVSLITATSFSGFSDLRSYYANPNFVGFSYIQNSSDNFYISTIVSGVLKTSNIDFTEEFVVFSGFSNVSKIETSNYSDLYFLSLSGNYFYQKVYPNNSFQLANVNIPSSDITIIRLDDRL